MARTLGLEVGDGAGWVAWPVMADPSEVDTQGFDRQRGLAVLDQIEGELTDIEHAFERLDDGTYGTCEACGQPISDDRLAVFPAARLCADEPADEAGAVRG